MGKQERYVALMGQTLRGSKASGAAVSTRWIPEVLPTFVPSTRCL